jgi:hypothetical protein
LPQPLPSSQTVSYRHPWGTFEVVGLLLVELLDLLHLDPKAAFVVD